MGSDAFSAATHEVNGATLSVDPVWKTINYFLDTRMSKGSLNELSAEKVEEYFTQFGQVAKLNIVEGKGFAFLQMSEKRATKQSTDLRGRTTKSMGTLST